MGAAFVQDAISLGGLGLAYKALGLGRTLIPELGGIVGAYGGSEVGEHLVNKYDAPKWVVPVATTFGGAVTGTGTAVGYNATKNYTALKNLKEIGYTGVLDRHVNNNVNAPKMHEVVKDFKGVM